MWQEVYRFFFNNVQVLVTPQFSYIHTRQDDNVYWQREKKRATIGLGPFIIDFNQLCHARSTFQLSMFRGHWQILSSERCVCVRSVHPGKIICHEKWCVVLLPFATIVPTKAKTLWSWHFFFKIECNIYSNRGWTKKVHSFLLYCYIDSKP